MRETYVNKIEKPLNLFNLRSHRSKPSPNGLPLRNRLCRIEPVPVIAVALTAWCSRSVCPAVHSPIVVIFIADGSHFARERLTAFTPWHLDAVSGGHPPHPLSGVERLCAIAAAMFYVAAR